MPCTLTQAHDQILARLRAALPSLHIRFPDRSVTEPKPPQSSWARVSISDNEENRPPPLVGSVGNRRYTTDGILTVQLFTLSGDGRRAAQTLAESVLRAYRGRRTSGGVWFRRERVRDVGPDGTYYQVNAIVEYQYDTIETGVERALSGGFSLAAVATGGVAQAPASISGGASLAVPSVSGDVTGAFDPASLTEISAWHRNTTLAGAVSSVDDLLNTNPMVQTDPDRQFTGNADGSITGSSKSLLLPAHASNNGGSLGFGQWINQPVAGAQWIISWITTPRIQMQLTANRGLILEFYTSGSNGRRFTTANNVVPANGTPYWMYWFYNHTLGGDANLRLSVNGASAMGGGAWSNMGTGGTGGALNATTTNIWGNLVNSDPGVAGFIGTMGRNRFTMSADITAPEEANLMAFEPLAA